MSEKDYRLAGLQLLRDNLEVFCAHCLKIKDQQGKMVPFIWNPGQHHIHASLEKQREETGMVRALILKGRQLGACFAPHHKVLMEDLGWRDIGDIKVGDKVVAVDEMIGDSGQSKAGRSLCRRYKTAVVEFVARHLKMAHKVRLVSGRELVVTGDHRMLSRQRGGVSAVWREVCNMQPGDFIRSAVRPPPEALTYEDGWFAGIIDGEGCRSSPSESSVSVSVSQVEGPVLERIKAYLGSIDVRYYDTADTREAGTSSKLGTKVVHRIEIGRLADVVHLMNRCRTSRIRFSAADLECRKIGGNRTPEGEGKQSSWDEIVGIEPVGEIEVVDLQTSAKTYIVEGLVSHNSTYIAARYYQKTTTRPGQSAFILAHEQKATDNLYQMVRRYHDHNPMPVSTGATNAKELIFDKLDGGYKLATAGTKDVGRSNTAQLIHASEAAFYDNAEMHMAGIGNTVAELPGTEIIMESTANGAGGNYFHKMWEAAAAGKNKYINIFVPWYWIETLRSKPRSNLKLSPDDELLMKLYGLSLEQMQWYIDKRSSYGEGFDWLARQEFPMCESEAFQSPTRNPLVSPHYVHAASTSDYYDESGALIIGCDPASDGAGTKDRTCIVFRRGRVVFRVEYHEKLNSMQVAGKLADYYREFHPDAMFVDKGGIGTGIVDRLQELNVPVVGVMFGQAASDSEIYANKKAEIWWRMKDWFEEQPVRIVNNPAFIADICAPQPDTSSNGRKLLEPKEKLERRGIRSPDGGDALALTFAEFVLSKAAMAGRGGSSYEAPSKAGY
jgi:intein/homing endonuclease